MPGRLLLAGLQFAAFRPSRSRTVLRQRTRARGRLCRENFALTTAEHSDVAGVISSGVPFGCSAHGSVSRLVHELGCGDLPLQRISCTQASRSPVLESTRLVALESDPKRWRASVKDAIIEPAIGRDVLALGAVRRPGLLRQVFAIAVGNPAQIVSLQKLRGLLEDKGALETVAHYLALFEDAYLIAPLGRFSQRVHRRRAAPSKLLTLNNALLSAMHPDGPPDPAREPGRFGQSVENACLAFAVNQRQPVNYWREAPLEIDAVFEGDWGNWAVEVKTSRFDLRELTGLLDFCRRNPKFRPLVISATNTSSKATVCRSSTGRSSWYWVLVR